MCQFPMVAPKLLGAPLPHVTNIAGTVFWQTRRAVVQDGGDVQLKMVVLVPKEGSTGIA